MCPLSHYRFLVVARGIWNALFVSTFLVHEASPHAPCIAFASGCSRPATITGSV